MEPTTQSPPAAPRPRDVAAKAPKAAPSHCPPPNGTSALVLSRTASPGFRIAVVVAVVVLLVVGIFVYRYVTSYESTDDAQVDGHINSISARISGHVVKLNVQDNQYVEAGTVLVEIDPADYQVAYDRAKAEFDDAQAAAAAAGVNVPITSVNTTSQVSATEADVASARAGIAAAKQQFEAAKAQLDQAEANNVKAQNDLGSLQATRRQTGNLAAAIRSGCGRRQSQRCRRRSRSRHGRFRPVAGDSSPGQTAAGGSQLAQRPDRARTNAGHSLQSRVGAGTSPAKESRPRSGAAESAIHQSRCSGRRSGQRPHRRSRTERLPPARN